MQAELQNINIGAASYWEWSEQAKNEGECRAASLRWCDAGNPFGCGHLAFLYRNGIGVPIDKAKAAALMARAQTATKKIGSCAPQCPPKPYYAPSSKVDRKRDPQIDKACADAFGQSSMVGFAYSCAACSALDVENTQEQDSCLWSRKIIGVQQLACCTP
jgi:hypothetical protein